MHVADLSNTALHPSLPAVGESFALTGVARRPDPTRVPVRGDLAHVRLAGQVFVPHYAAPMARVLAAPARLLAAPAGAAQAALPAGEVLAELPAGTVFDLLDIVAGHGWGEVPSAGLVGYVALDQLEDLA